MILVAFPGRRLERECETEIAGTPSPGGGARGHPRTQERPPTISGSPLSSPPRRQFYLYRGPSGIELARRSGRAAPGDAVGLLDEHDADALGEGSVLGRL